MPRSSRSGGGGRSAPSGSRGASTATFPSRSNNSYPIQKQPQQQTAPAQYGAQQQQPRQPGLFANMASTAAGVAVGSSVGHAVSGMLFGGGGGHAAPPADQQQQGPLPTSFDQSGNYNAQSAYGQTQSSCDVQSKELMKCLDATGNDMSACQYYLDSLRACSAAARSFA